MSRLFRIAWLQFRVSLSAAIAYRVDFLLHGAMELVWIALMLLPLLILYDGRSEVAGWDRSAAYVLMAYFIGLRSVLECMVNPSLIDLVERIRSGAFDYTLLKPIDAQWMVSTSRFEPWRALGAVVAIGLLVYAFVLRGAPPSVGEAAAGIGLFISGALAMYSIWIVCAAAAFWVGRLDNLIFLLGSVFDVARWPVQVFRGLWRVFFTFVIPVALMTTYPAMAMLGRLDGRTAAAAIGGALVMVGLSRAVWRAAIASYTSASS